jgi:hypothetical protein
MGKHLDLKEIGIIFGCNSFSGIVSDIFDLYLDRLARSETIKLLLDKYTDFPTVIVGIISEF